MKSKPFSLTKIKRKGRNDRWRVRGHLHGQRLSKTFADLGKAKAWRDAKEIERTNANRSTRATLTRLDDAQAFDAEKALAILDGKATLSEAARAFLASYVEPGNAKTVEEAAKLYHETRDLDVKRGLLSKSQRKGTRYRVNRFANWYGIDEPLAKVTTATFQAFLDGTFTGPKNYENTRGAISHFFKWALAQGFLNADPTVGVLTLGRRIKKARGVAVTKSPAEIRDLFAWLESNAPEIVPAYALMTFAGIRPCYVAGEIRKLDESQVNLASGVITILPEVSKVNEKRKFEMPDNLVAWLRAYPRDRFPIVCANWGRLRRKITKQFELSQDVLRHSAITYWVAKNKSHFEAARQFGNSESVIRKHYQDNDRTDDEADAFFDIYPREAGGKLVKFA